MNLPEAPKEYDFGFGELTELTYLQQVFGISRRTAIKYLRALHIQPVYVGKQILFSLPTLKRILFVLSKPGGAGFAFPGSGHKGNPRFIKNPDTLIEVTDEILEQAADPATLSEMAGVSGRDAGILRKFVARPVGRPPKEDDDG